MPTSETPVFLQDYHLVLAALYLRRGGANVRTALFWHIPWQNPDRLLMCQWRRELLAGLLANDLARVSSGTRFAAISSQRRIARRRD